MTDIEQKALAYACECAGRAPHHYALMGDDLPLKASITAHARAIEQHEAFRQEVSDALEGQFIGGIPNKVRPFILPKPVDPLVEAMHDCGVDRFESWADQLRAALAARGLEITQKKEQN